MKPIKLKIKGLNSFIEDQTIDFEKLTDRGLFGIFGPTGSGKSTILDGITLALYGEVSRKSSNYINTNCKSLNVSFEFQISGAETKRYIVDRDFRRDNKTGNPRAVNAKIVDITDGGEDVLADRSTTVTKQCEEIIGLGIDDFTRTVVLPQGKFSEFLKLSGKERREMLERLFNLQKYGDNLSRKLSAEITREKTENSVLLGQLKGYEDISEEKFNEKNKELDLANENLNKAKVELEELNKVFKANEELWNLQLELATYKEKESKLKEYLNEIDEKKLRVNIGEAANRVSPHIIAYEKTVLDIMNTEKEIKLLNENVEKIKNEKEVAEKQLALATEKKDKEIPQLKLKEEKVNDAIEEQKVVNALNKEIDDINKKYQELRSNYLKNSDDLKTIETEIKNNSNKISEDEAKVESLKIDANLKVKVQQGILDTESYNSINKLVDKNKKAIEFIESTIAKAKNEEAKYGKEFDEKVKMLEESKVALENVIKNCPGEQTDLLQLNSTLLDSREKWNKFNKLSTSLIESEKLVVSLKATIENYKNSKLQLEKELSELNIKHKDMVRENLAHSLREELASGEVCPVCGSTEHHKEKIKVVEIVDLSKIENEITSKDKELRSVDKQIVRSEATLYNEEDKIKEITSQINELGEDFKKISVEELEEKFNKLQKDLSEYEKNKKNIETNIAKLTEEKFDVDGKINKAKTVISENEKQLQQVNAEYSENSIKLKEVKDKIDILVQETKVTDFISKNKEINEQEKQREALINEIKELRNKTEVLNKNRDAIQNEITKIKEEGATQRALLDSKKESKEEKLTAIKSKVGDSNDLLALLDSIKGEINNIEETFKKAEALKKEIDEKFQSINDKLSQTTGKNNELKDRSKSDKETLDKALASEGFNNLEHAKESALSIDNINKLKKNIEEYNESVSKVKGAIESLNKKINGKEISEDQWSTIKNNKELKDNEIKEINEAKIKLQEEVKSIKNKLKELSDLLKKKEKLEYKLGLLDDLDKLFKGKKFVEFVATNQLKYVSIEASKRLKEITNGNYGLEVDENGKFIIRDYKNGGAERDASTLSGGETFLTSLALALALSSQIQLKGTAPLELFFLDEGFGTLDDNLLDVVMNSLEKIHNDKLKVGIISHVESIKNRVPVKLILTPAESGRGGSKVKIERS